MAKSSTLGSVRLCWRQLLARKCSRWQLQHPYRTILVAGCRAVLRRAESRAHRPFISSTRPRVCERQGLRQVHRILSLLSRQRRLWQAGMIYCRFVPLLSDVCFVWRNCCSECTVNTFSLRVLLSLAADAASFCMHCAFGLFDSYLPLVLQRMTRELSTDTMEIANLKNQVRIDDANTRLLTQKYDGILDLSVRRGPAGAPG